MAGNELSFRTQHPVSSYFLLAFILTWIVGLIFVVFVEALFPQPVKTISNIFGKYGPTLAGIIMAQAVSGKAGLRRLFSGLLAFKLHPKWYMFALFAPLVFTLTSIGLYSVFGGEIKQNWSITGWSILFPLFLKKLFLGGGLGEELGWRGFALPQLQNRMNGLSASFVIGIVWGLWHLPAYLLASNLDGEMPFLMFLVFVLAGSIILTWMYNSTNGNLLLVVLFHAAVNAAWSLFEILIPTSAGQVSAMAWFTGLFGVLALVIVFVYGAENLSKRKKVVWKIGAI